MRCPSCNHDNSADASFFDACGAKLDSICATCGTTNQPDARFCKKCGTRIATKSAPAKPAAASSNAASAAPNIRVAPESASPEALEGERKTVTALFADIKGSTELMEELDPEEARAIIDPALKLMIEAAHRYDGYVVQSTGDGIFALFGAPVAHEDHPQRALYAALRMQEEMGRYSAKVVADGGMPIEARVGVNTGEVVVRSISTGGGNVEYTPIGHTTNLASRMQAVAPTGSIAIAEPTRKFVEGYFALRPLGPTKVKGVSEPVNVYEVTGLGPLRTRLQRSAGRGLTKFVGREREMDAMKHAAEQAKSGHGQIEAAMAEAGTGKSRLFFEFKAISQTGWKVLNAFSVSHGKASPFFPVIELLHGYFGITADDDARARRAKVTGHVLTLARALEDSIPYLFALLGISEGEDQFSGIDEQSRRRNILDSVKRILVRESLNQPLMIIFEDLHWIDPDTQVLLNLIADSIGTTRILLLVNYRPEYSHQWNSKTYYTQLRLDPLGGNSAEEMLSSLLGDGAELKPLKRLIIEKTEGNPFFMEETVQVLVDEGVLIRNGTVKLTRPLEELKIPPTVQAILASRIDRLPLSDKELLQTLAVIGKEFPFNLIKSTIGKNDDELKEMLSNLQLAEFIYEQPAVGDIEYVFKHALTQEVAYNSILTQRRRVLHEAVGREMETLFAGQLDFHYEQLAFHYRNGISAEKAIHYLLLAGEQGAIRSASAQAAAHFKTALDLIPQLTGSSERNRSELKLQMALGSVLTSSQGWASQEKQRSFERARVLCENIDDADDLLPILWNLGVINLVQGKLRIALEIGRRLPSLAEKSGRPSFLLAAYVLIGEAEFMMGDLDQGIADMRRAVEACEPSHDIAALFGIDLWLLIGPILGWAEHISGNLNGAKEWIGKVLECTLEHPHAYSRAFSLMQLAAFYLIRNDPPPYARDLAEQSISLSSEKFFLQTRDLATFYGTCAESAEGSANDVSTRLAEVIALIDRAWGADLLMTMILGIHAEVCLRAKCALLAQDSLHRGFEIAERNGEVMFLAELHRLQGELFCGQLEPDLARAEESFRKAVQLSRDQGAKLFELRATVRLVRLLASQGRRDEARARLAEIYSWFTEGFDTTDLKDGKALLEEL
jgi:class 3 adenylate cyclase/tetratricopeptide (TPR) repeat protein